MLTWKQVLAGLLFTHVCGVGSMSPAEVSKAVSNLSAVFAEDLI